MNKAIYRVATCIALCSISAPAIAGPNWAVQPIQAGQETVRFNQGVPTLDLELKDGVVQVTPLGIDHGSLAFGVAVYNDSRQPANFGIENVAASTGGGSLRAFTKDELERQAKNRATWTQIGLAFLGAAAATAAASQRSYYRSTYVTPRGTYRSYWSMPSAVGQVQATAIAAGTGYGLVAVQNQLDRTVETLGDEIVQLTTIDPGESYAGRIILQKFSPKSLPSQLVLTVNWNGESYSFTFQVAKPGTPPPPFLAITRASDLTDFSPRDQLPTPTATTVLPPVPSRVARGAGVRQHPVSVAPARGANELRGGVRCLTCR